MRRDSTIRWRALCTLVVIIDDVDSVIHVERYDLHLAVLSHVSACRRHCCRPIDISVGSYPFIVGRRWPRRNLPTPPSVGYINTHVHASLVSTDHYSSCQQQTQESTMSRFPASTKQLKL